MKDWKNEVITNVQNEEKDKPTLGNSNIAWDDLEGYSLKYNIPPAEVIARYLAEDMSQHVEADERHTQMARQAKMALDVIRLAKESEGEKSGGATFILKGIELQD